MFLYELIFNLLLAAFLVWLGRRREIRPPGLFALYVAGYSGFRIWEETERIDPSKYLFGLASNSLCRGRALPDRDSAGSSGRSGARRRRRTPVVRST